MLILCLVLLTGMVQVFAEAGGAAPYLRMGVGARARGLGKAFSAVADDATANYYNPAGLVQLQKKEFSFMLSNLSVDRKLSYLSYVHPFNENYIGISWLAFGIDNIEERGMTGTLDSIFEYGNTAYQFSYGRKVIEKLSLGGSLKYVDSKFKGLSNPTISSAGKADGWGLDFGLLYTPYEKLRLALVIQDLWSKLDWKTGRTETIPNVLKIGSAYSVLEDRLLFSAEIERDSYSEDNKINIGVEWWIIKMLGVRLGSRDGHFSGGFGLRTEVSNFGFEIDYAYLEDTFSEDFDENAGHQFSLNVKF